VPYAGISAWVTMAAVGSVADRLPEIFGWLGSRGITPAGPPFFRYHVIDMERKLLIEAGVPVASEVADDGDIHGGTLPAGRFAVMTHTGAPQTLVAATSALLDWAAERDLTWDMSETDAGQKWGCRLEIYLTDPAGQPDVNMWETQLAFRLAD
jgi:effector-binding domain-containing protein